MAHNFTHPPAYRKTAELLWPDDPFQPFPGSFSTTQTIQAPFYLDPTPRFDAEAVADDEDNSSVDDDSQKCPYGDLVLLYIPACDDEELHSSILALSPDCWVALMQEANPFEENAKALFSEDQQIASQAQENIAEKLREMDPLHEGQTGDVLTEIQILAANRATYIPSTIVKEHLRRGQTVPAARRSGYFRQYRVDHEAIIAAAQQRRAVTLVEQDPVDDGHTQPRRVSFDGIDIRSVKDTLYSSLDKVINDWTDENIGKFEHYTEGNLLELVDENLGTWLTDINKGLEKRREIGGQLPDDQITWDTDYKAQLLRYYASSQGGLETSLKELQINAAYNGKVQISLVEGYASATYYCPNRAGYHAQIQLERCKLDFGYLRGHITFEASGFVGASLLGSAAIGLRFDQESKTLRVSPQEVSKDRKQSGAKASVEAFAGLQASGKATGGLSWRNPEEGEFKELFAIGVGFTGAAGIGAKGDFLLTYNEETGKIQFRIKGQLVIGLGLGGEVVGSVGVVNHWQFVTFVYHQLNNNDFSYLEFMDDGCFNAYTGLVLMAIEGVGDALLTVGDGVEALVDLFQAASDYYEERELAEQKAETMATNILAKPKILKFAPPEAVGAMLYVLSDSFWLSREELQEDAIIVLLENCQSKEEFRKVISRITPEGKKNSYEAGRERLLKVLDFSQETKFDALERRHKKLAYLLDKQHYPDSPNPMQPIQQRVFYA